MYLFPVSIIFSSTDTTINTLHPVRCDSFMVNYDTSNDCAPGSKPHWFKLLSIQVLSFTSSYSVHFLLLHLTFVLLFLSQEGSVESSERAAMIEQYLQELVQRASDTNLKGEALHKLWPSMFAEMVRDCVLEMRDRAAFRQASLAKLTETKWRGPKVHSWRHTQTQTHVDTDCPDASRVPSQTPLTPILTHHHLVTYHWRPVIKVFGNWRVYFPSVWEALS